MEARTQYLSKLIGLYCVLLALGMLLHKQATLDSVTTILHDPPLLLVLGVFTSMIGLALVLGHNVWSGGLRPLLVTISGWSALIKGSMYLFLPAQTEANVFQNYLYFQQYFYAYMALTLVMGLVMTYLGFSAREA